MKRRSQTHETRLTHKEVLILIMLTELFTSKFIISVWSTGWSAFSYQLSMSPSCEVSMRLYLIDPIHTCVHIYIYIYVTQHRPYCADVYEAFKHETETETFHKNILINLFHSWDNIRKCLSIVKRAQTTPEKWQKFG